MSLITDYTTDTHDHDREEAENKLNESLMDDVQVQPIRETKKRLSDGNSENSDDSIECSDCSDLEDEVFWNVHDFSAKAPPRTLLDLTQRLSM